jgi:hypothetical protein
VKEVSESGFAVVIGRAQGSGGWRRSVCLCGGSGFGLGGTKLVFFLRRCGVWLGVDGFLLLLAKPSGFIDIGFGERRGGFVLGGGGATVRDQAFDGHDHGEGFDLAGNAVACHFGAQFGDFPEAVQDLFAALFVLAQSLRGTAGEVGVLFEELLLHGGTVLEHVGADTRFGLGVGGGVGVEADGLGGGMVGHGSREDEASKGHFLIGDEVTGFIFGHRWLLGLLIETLGRRVFRTVQKVAVAWQGAAKCEFFRFPGEKTKNGSIASGYVDCQPV